MLNQIYDVIIVGAGPAGIFAALEITEHSNLKILILEKGRKVSKRRCPISGTDSACSSCTLCSIMSGWGGAGAFSDGKLTLTTEFGGWLTDYIGKSQLQQLIDYVDNIYVGFGAPDRVFGNDDNVMTELQLRAARHNLKLIPARIRHMGTENTAKVLANMYHHLEQKVKINTEEIVENIIINQGKITGVRTKNGTYFADKIILAPGRDGAQWFFEQAQSLGLTLSNNQIDLGVRIEIPAITMQDFTDKIWEPKIIYNTHTFDDIVRTFCVNPNGHVVMENTNGIITVNGHSFAENKSANTNFALLMSQKFTEPFNQPVIYGRYIASLANMLSGAIIVQRYGDLKKGRRSTALRIQRGMVEPTLKGAVPGDLSLVLPHRFMVGVKECLEALDRAIPGVASEHTLLYGVEVKFYSARPYLTDFLRTEIRNLWTIGDGAGVTRGLIQASVSGVIAARDLLSIS